jgi:hypothetical protein
MSGFSSLKNNRQGNLDKLTQELQKMNTASAGSSEDARFWKATVDKAGNGSATIRFLPAPEGETVPFARIFNHAFKGPTGKWYIENCLTSIGQADPVAELNSKLWNKSDDDNSPERKQARAQKRKLIYIGNILVIKDPAEPANEGKVFLYKYGKKIFDKLNDLLHPTDDEDDAINPWDMWEGANLRLKIRQVDGYRNYDKSDFSTPSAISDDDAELEKIWNSQYPILEFLDPKNFKPYAELKRHMAEVLVLEDEYDLPARKATRKVVEEELDDIIPDFDVHKKAAASVANAKKASVVDDDEDDEDVMKYFNKIANSDD